MGEGTVLSFDFWKGVSQQGVKAGGERVECDAASDAVRDLRHATEGGNWDLAIAGEMQGGQELPICSCTVLNVLPLHI